MSTSYDLAERINSEVNSSVTYKTDMEQYGVPEFWDVAGKYGDCEDYALLKRARLLDAGWPLESMALVFCRVPPDMKGHYVLWVDTDKGGFVLDNRYSAPRNPESLEYTWEIIQRGTEWVELLSWS